MKTRFRYNLFEKKWFYLPHFSSQRLNLWSKTCSELCSGCNHSCEMSRRIWEKPKCECYCCSLIGLKQKVHESQQVVESDCFKGCSLALTLDRSSVLAIFWFFTSLERRLIVCACAGAATESMTQQPSWCLQACPYAALKKRTKWKEKNVSQRQRKIECTCLCERWVLSVTQLASVCVRCA